MCCAGSGLNESDANGVCPECGELTCNGEAIDCCEYSPCNCDTCGRRLCDGSC